MNLESLYQHLNTEYFDDSLPLCQILWSKRLTRTAGHIRVDKRIITLSVPLLSEAFAERGHNVCGVWCETSETALREIMKHEMIHLWLYVQKLPHGHTVEFRRKAKAIGQPKTRHEISLPRLTTFKSGWVYICKSCDTRIVRKRRMGRIAACGACCKRYSKGKYDSRFQLRGTKITEEMVKNWQTAASNFKSGT